MTTTAQRKRFRQHFLALHIPLCARLSAWSLGSRHFWRVQIATSFAVCTQQLVSSPAAHHSCVRAALMLCVVCAGSHSVRWLCRLAAVCGHLCTSDGAPGLQCIAACHRLGWDAWGAGGKGAMALVARMLSCACGTAVCQQRGMCGGCKIE
jgi:hypothetical protein